MGVKRISRTAGAVVAAAAMAVGLAGCEPPETWWPTMLDGPEVQGPRSTAVVGDFDEDGLEDVYWYAPGSSGQAEELWTARPEGGFDRAPAPSVTGSYDPVAGDFDGDGDDDILWLGVEGGGSVWTFEGGHVASRRSVDISPSLDAEHVVVIERASGPDHVGLVVGDASFISDGLWIWDPLQDDWFDSAYVEGGRAPLPFAGDFDGDGHGDVLLYGYGSRPDSIGWGRADGGYDTQTLAINGTYWIAVLDADGDGRDDIVFFQGPQGTAPTVPLWRGRAGRWFAKTNVGAPTVSGDIWAQEDRGDGRDNVIVRAEGVDQVWELGADGAATIHTIPDFQWGVPVLGQFSAAGRDDMYVWGYRKDRLYLSPQG